MKRMFGKIEMIFDGVYLITATLLGIFLISSAQSGSARFLSGVMALVLAFGDSFHLLPRMASIYKADQTRYIKALGIGKLITSVTMTIFYLILWQVGLMAFPQVNGQKYTLVIYILAVVRIILCLLPQNKWTEVSPPVSFGILRNIPFLFQGLGVAILYFIGGQFVPSLSAVPFAILISFACYLPVVLYADKNPKIGMLMLPKTCAYLWLLFICLSL